MKEVKIHLQPIKDDGEKDKVLKEIKDKVFTKKNDLINKLKSLSLKRLITSIFVVMVTITSIAINITQAVFGATIITEETIQNSKWFNIATIVICAIAGLYETFITYQRIESNLIKIVESIYECDKLLSSVEKIHLTLERDRDPEKIKKVRDKYAIIERELRL